MMRAFTWSVVFCDGVSVITRGCLRRKQGDVPFVFTSTVHRALEAVQWSVKQLSRRDVSHEWPGLTQAVDNNVLPAHARIVEYVVRCDPSPT